MLLFYYYYFIIIIIIFSLNVYTIKESKNKHVVNFICVKMPRLSESLFMIGAAPTYNHMEKADFLYFEVEAPKRINLIMFMDISMTFSAKIRKRLRCVFQ